MVHQFDQVGLCFDNCMEPNNKIMLNSQKGDYRELFLLFQPGLIKAFVCRVPV